MHLKTDTHRISHVPLPWFLARHAVHSRFSAVWRRVFWQLCTISMQCGHWRQRCGRWCWRCRLSAKNDDSPLVYRKYCDHKYVHRNKKRYESTVDNEQDALLQNAFKYAHRLKVWYIYIFSWYVCTSHNVCISFTQPGTWHVTWEFRLHTCEVINKYELCENLWSHKPYRVNCVLINALYFCILQSYQSVILPINSFSLS